MKKLLPLFLLIIFSCSKNDEETKNRFSLIVDSSEGGYVSSSGGDYEEGSLVSVSAFANDGYIFIGWTGSSTSTFSEVEITMNEKAIIDPLISKGRLRTNVKKLMYFPTNPSTFVRSYACSELID